MKKERFTKLRAVTSDAADSDLKDVSNVSETFVHYQSNPMKMNLYSKLLAYRQSLKKFNIKDLIRDTLK